MYQWETDTKDCPPFSGGVLTVCPRCGLQKWKHFVRAFWLCDGSGFISAMYGDEHTGKTWIGVCQGCLANTSMEVVAERWYAHR